MLQLQAKKQHSSPPMREDREHFDVVSIRNHLLPDLNTVDSPHPPSMFDTRGPYNSGCRDFQDLHVQSVGADSILGSSSGKGMQGDNMSDRWVLDALVTALAAATSDRDDDPFEPFPLPADDVGEEIHHILD